MPFTEYVVLHHSLAKLHLSCCLSTLHFVLSVLFVSHFIQQYLENFMHFIFEELIFQAFSSCSHVLAPFLLTYSSPSLCLLFQCAFMCEAIFCVFACLVVFMCVCTCISVYLYMCVCIYVSVFYVRVSCSCFVFVYLF